MASIENFCIFIKKNGKVIFRNYDLITDKPLEYYYIIGEEYQQEEYIKYEDVYVDQKNRKYYKIYHLNNNNEYCSRFLEWKKTKDNTWDWYTSDINGDKLVNVIDTINTETIYKLNDKTNEITTKVYNILKEYKLSNNELKQILNDIMIKAQ